MNGLSYFVHHLTQFQAIIEEIYNHCWCVTPNCSICGTFELKLALKTRYKENPESYVKGLARIFSLDIKQYNVWKDFIRVAFSVLNHIDEMDNVILKWLEVADNDPQYHNYLHHYFVKPMTGYLPLLSALVSLESTPKIS